MRPIRRLDESVAQRIAAGEVVERPVSAVKEMIENSLDAGASDIRIALEQGGKQSIVIEDDGAGIAFGELPLALERSATSKIASLADLERVSTLGYRGEALASIAAVSRLEIRSRAEGDDEGGLISAEAGAITTHTRVPAQRGTRVRVDDLFYNLPARRKFLKGSAAEAKRIVQVAQDYALVRPEVRFRLSNDGRELLDAGSARTTDDVLAALWGEENRAISERVSRDGVSLSIWWNNMPGSRRVSVTLFVNGRRVTDPTVRAAMNSTGAVLYGDWVLMLSMPPEEVDVNIHPAKAEIRFRHTGPIFDVVRRGTERLLTAGGGFAPKDAHSPEWGPASVPDDSPMRGGGELFSGTPPPPPQSAERAERALFTRADAGPARKYLGQAQGGYLVFDDPRGLCLVDAHAAHERILYEEIEDHYHGKVSPTQRLVSPQDVPPALAASVALARDELRGMGFSFEFPGEGSADRAVMVTLPALRGLGRLSPVEMLRSALKGIEEESDPSKRDREVWWRWARTACRDAIKLGRALSAEEANDLFDRLERCRSPYSCPHGRPTTIFLAGDKLKSWFER